VLKVALDLRSAVFVSIVDALFPKKKIDPKAESRINAVIGSSS